MRPARGGGSVPAFRGFLAGIGVGLLISLSLKSFGNY